MKARLMISCCVLAALTAAAPAQRISLNDAQRARLKELVAADAEAKDDFARIRKKADGALDDEPNPIQSIRSEGKLAKDPAKIRTHESMADMHKIFCLAYAWAVTDKADYAAKAGKFLAAWAKVNRSRGDPIDDTGLDDAIVAFDLVQKQLPAEDRKEIEKWLRQVAEAELKSGTHGYNNWNSHRLKIMGLIGFALEDKKLIDAAVEGYKKQIDRNLKPDGSSIDFHDRDALHYHTYDIEPLLTLAIAAQMNGIDLYHYAAGGASLGKAVAFLFPYCEGKEHKEFVNTKVGFDRARAKAGQAEYEAGHPWNPKAAAGTLILNGFFDKETSGKMLRTIGVKFTNYPSFEAVVEEAQRTGNDSPAKPPAGGHKKKH